MKTILFTLSLLTYSFFVHSQEKKIIFFKDKAESSFVKLTDRSEKRRENNAVKVSEEDREISSAYINQISVEGKIIKRSRWLNAIVIETSATEAELLSKYAFIDDVWEMKGKPNLERKDVFEYSSPKALNYGTADTQVRQIDADCLHDLGYTGAGVYMAIIDAGFSGMDTIQYFDSVYNQGRVLDTYDFVNGSSVYNYSLHGTAVSSCVFGYKGGVDPYAGTAVDVDVALYVSEDVGSETLIEEFNLVMALERCDMMGVDIANISLGYTEFDDPADNHDYSVLNGSTTIAALGVNTAVTKGIVVVAAAGNSGPSNISTPCDADSCLCVGAVDNLGNYAPFSSLGPASDGAVKPDVAATGWHTWVILDDGSLVMGNGTSFASPVMAGGVACLIQANPNRTAAQVIEAVRESGSQYSMPDEFLGYGIPTLCTAHDSLQVSGVGFENLSMEDISIYPNPVNTDVFIEGLPNGVKRKLEILNLTGQVVAENKLQGLPVERIDVSFLTEGVYLIRIVGVQHTYKMSVSH